MRRVAGAVRRLPERLLHPLRRRRAVRRLRDRALSGSNPILVVCHGNICRSPYASASLARMTSGSTGPPEVDSAGFIGPGRRSPGIARLVAAERGVDLGGHRSRLITSDMLAEAGLIVVMTPAQAQVLRQAHGVPDRRVLVLGDLDPQSVTTREIPDPFDQPKEVFSEVFERIDRCLKIAAGLLAGS